MRAVAVRRFRDPPEEMELDPPPIMESDALVRVQYAGMNPFDGKIADGILDGHRPHVFPLVLGIDAAGIVEAVGPDAKRFQVGDRIFGYFLHDPVGIGTYAELATVPEGIAVARIPPSLGSEEAAAMPMAGMTALASLDALALTRGATLVVVGASGGVGSFAIELAAAQGIGVMAIARASSSARLRSLGAEEVLDPSSSDAPSEVARAHPSGADGLLDLMSDRVGFARWAALVRRGGAAVSTTYSADVDSLKQAGVRGENVKLQPTSELLQRLVQELVTHHLKVPVERRVRLSEAPAALADLKAGRAAGKTVIDLAGGR